MDDYQANVDSILGSPRIRGKLVILCEGDRIPLDERHSVPSPQMYRRLEKMPDANFYKACVPRDWHGSRLPQFFNCGGRSDVIRTFQALLKGHAKQPAASYLSPDKLYALVDLDVQPGGMPDGYPWATTEDIHASLYENGLLRSSIDLRHRIWVTAFIHKEAFFVFRVAESLWTDGGKPFLNGVPLSIRELHAQAARMLATDSDVAARLSVVEARLSRFTGGHRLDCSCAQQLADSWATAAALATDAEYDALAGALLAVAKIKPIWSKVTPAAEVRTDVAPETFRDQLALRVARAIADLKPGTHPLADFFAWLKLRR